MASVVFMHGSAGGQTTLTPPECPELICKDISDKYFRGRNGRKEESGTKLSLFVELYKTTYEQYCVYSFVNNECCGTDGREGQYLSITVLCKNAYVYPEAVYKMLHSAYNQMCATEKVIQKNKGGKDRYVIAQFSNQKEYLLKLIELIGKAFNSIACCQRALGVNCESANYESWKGTKINMDNCNSDSTYTKFCECGRIYVSEEYESPSAIIKRLEEKIQRIEQEKEKSKEKIIETKNTENSGNRKEKEQLGEQLRQLRDEINRLNSENEKYKDSIDIVCKELNKFSKASKKASAEKSQLNKHSTKYLLKTFIFLAILILTVISSIVNYCFFRDISIALEEHTQSSIDFGLKIVDEHGKTKSHNSSVSCGQKLKASINTSNHSDSCGWMFSHCKVEKINNKGVSVVITGKPGENAEIAYGDKNDQQGRQRITLKIKSASSGGGADISGGSDD